MEEKFQNMSSLEVDSKITLFLCSRGDRKRLYNKIGLKDMEAVFINNLKSRFYLIKVN